MAYWRGSETPLKKASETPANEWISRVGMRERHDTVMGSAFADQNGTLYIEQSSDGTNWDVSSPFEITANDGKGFEENLVLPYWRIRFKNTASSDQTIFRISVVTQAGGDSQG